MRVFVIGATGYVGGAVARRLKHDGHDVIAGVRNDAARDRAVRLGYETVHADVAEPATLVEPARGAEATVYAVQLQRPDAAAVDGAALRAIGGILAQTKGTFIYTSGAWYYGNTGDKIADENAPPNPPAVVAERPQTERIALDSTKGGVRAMVIRPGDVYGLGGGLPAMFVQMAREHGAARTIGDGQNRWPVVHCDDLADLYVRMLESAAPGAVYNAADETAFTQREIAEAAARAAGKNGAVHAWPVEEAAAVMGEWVKALAMDQRISSDRARSQLGWSTRAAGIIEDLERGSYAQSTAGGASGTAR
jgi:nucleoside-diphosphate-sugar epimerase